MGARWIIASNVADYLFIYLRYFHRSMSPLTELIILQWERPFNLSALAQEDSIFDLFRNAPWKVLIHNDFRACPPCRHQALSTCTDTPRRSLKSSNTPSGLRRAFPSCLSNPLCPRRHGNWCRLRDRVDGLWQTPPSCNDARSAWLR